MRNDSTIYWLVRCRSYTRRDVREVKGTHRKMEKIPTMPESKMSLICPQNQTIAPHVHEYRISEHSFYVHAGGTPLNCHSQPVKRILYRCLYCWLLSNGGTTSSIMTLDSESSAKSLMICVARYRQVVLTLLSPTGLLRQFSCLDWFLSDFLYHNRHKMLP